MKLRNACGILACVAALAAGCDKTASTPPPAAPGTPAESPAGGTKHTGWWCDEHGVPELECSMCSTKAAKACEAKGDWCAKHERAKSQCYVCDPKLREKYAAQYKAKTGKEMPEPVEQFSGK